MYGNVYRKFIYELVLRRHNGNKTRNQETKKMHADAANQILNAVHEALAAIREVREAQTDLYDKVEIGEIETLLAQVNGRALDAFILARRQ